MKKISALFLSSLFAISASAQHFDLGLHASGGTTWMINNNISDQGPELDEVASFAPLFGLRAQYGSKSTTICMELNYAPVYQKYKGTFGTASAKGKDKANYLSIPLLVQLHSTSGFYFEIGPQFSFLMSAKSQASLSPTVPGADYTGRDVKTSFKGMVIGGAIGVGGQWPLADKLSLTAGLRLAYGFTDATKEYSVAEYANVATSEHMSITTDYAHMDQKGAFSYKHTHIATGHIIVGVSYNMWDAKKKKKATTDMETEDKMDDNTADENKDDENTDISKDKKKKTKSKKSNDTRDND